MENREFISAANLPTTEANEVDVLCVENGELKRKPAKGLGGCSTITFKTKETVIDKEDEFFEEFLVTDVPKGTFKRLKDGVTSGEPVLVMEACESNRIYVDGSFSGIGIYNDWYAYITISGTDAELLGTSELFSINDGSFYLLPDDRILTWKEFEDILGGGGE